jgi:hypothetical protein
LNLRQCWVVAALLALVCAPAHAATAELLAFKPGNPKAKAALARVPELRDLVAERFAVAFVDLDGDGQMEIVVNAESSAYCGSGGCATVVLQQQGDRMVVLLYQNLFPVIGVTREKFGGYRALAALGEGDRILVGEKMGTPMYRKPLIYPMQAKASAAVPAAPPSQKAATSSTTLETIVNVLAIPAGAQQSPNASWTAIAKLPGIEWRDRNLRQRGREAVRSGQVMLAGLGSTAITWAGMPDAAFAADVRTGTRVASGGYLGMLKAQFSPTAKLRVVRGGCKDAVFAQSAVFELVLPGKQPAYLLLDTKASWNAGNTTIQVSPVNESSRWAC